MKEPEFTNYLQADENITSKSNTIRSRINKGKMIERHFGVSLDDIVCDDDKTYEALQRIKAEMKDTNGTVSNALRKYYSFMNNRAFPALAKYKD